jgi:hypothetical protein
MSAKRIVRSRGHNKNKSGWNSKGSLQKDTDSWSKKDWWGLLTSNWQCQKTKIERQIDLFRRFCAGKELNSKKQQVRSSNINWWRRKIAFQFKFNLGWYRRLVQSKNSKNWGGRKGRLS